MTLINDSEDSFKTIVEFVTADLQKFFESDAVTSLDYDQLSESIYIKNVDRIITFSNDSYRTTFSSGKSTVGMRTDTFLQESNESISNQSDSLILSGVNKIEFEHIGFGSDYRKYLFRTYKQSLIEKRYEPFAILGISRPIKELGDEHESDSQDLFQLFKVYSQLSDQDKTICLNLAIGKTTSEIAETMEMTTRAIEIHRKKILQRMGFSRPVEIVIAMTRFDERKLVNYSRGS